MEYKGLQIEHFTHDTFRIKALGKVIYIDPFEISAEQIKPADLILSSHHHFDHCSVEDIKKLVTLETIIVAGGLCSEKLQKLKNVKEVINVVPNQDLEITGVKIQTVPAYNLDKWRSEGVPYHPRQENHVGYIVEIGNIRIYHAGDTDKIPEMSQLKNIDIALLPVSGIYVMTWQEAVEATKVIKPKLAIPTHYSSIVGTQADARNFKENADCAVEIL